MLKTAKVLIIEEQTTLKMAFNIIIETRQPNTGYYVDSENI